MIPVVHGFWHNKHRTEYIQSKKAHHRLSVRRKKTRHKALLHFIPFTVKKLSLIAQNRTKKKNFIKKGRKKITSISKQ